LPPSVIYPQGGAMVEGSLTVQWTTVNGAQSYELQIAGTSDFNNPVIVVKDIRTINYGVNLSESENEYFIRVRAINDSIPGAWSDTIIFYTRITSPDMFSHREENMEVYPNPFREFVSLDLYLHKPEIVSIGLYDMTGKKLLDIYNGIQPAGVCSFRIENVKILPGSYIVNCRTETAVFTKKLVKR
jgi:hypothetical protein